MKKNFSAILGLTLVLMLTSFQEMSAQKILAVTRHYTPQPMSWGSQHKNSPPTTHLQVYDFTTQKWEEIEWLNEDLSSIYHTPFSNPDQSVLYLFESAKTDINNNNAVIEPAKLYSIDPATYAVKEEMDFGQTSAVRGLGGGSSPVFSPDGSRVYIPWLYGKGVLEINLNDKTHKVLELQPKRGIRSIQDLAITPDGKTLYVARYAEIESFDLSTGTYNELPFGRESGLSSSGIAISPDGTRLYAMLPGKIVVYDLANKSKLKTIYANGNKLEISPDGKQLYVLTLGESFMVQVFDAMNFEKKQSIYAPDSRGYPPFRGSVIAKISDDGQWLCFSQKTDGIIGDAFGDAWAYDLSNPLAIKKMVKSKNIPIKIDLLPPKSAGGDSGSAPEAPAATIAKPIAIIPSFENDLVSLLDPETGRLENEIMVGDGPQSITNNTAEKEIYVGNQIDGSISVIDPISRIVKHTFSLGLPSTAQLIKIIADPSGSTIYVTARSNTGEGKLFIYDTGSNSLSPAITLSGKPSDAILSADSKQLFLSISTNPANGALDIVDLASKSVQTISFPNQSPKALALSNDGGQLYFASENRAAGSNPPGLLNVIPTAMPVADPDPVSLNGIPKFMTIQPDGKHLFLAGEQHVDQFETVTNKVTALNYTPGTRIDALIAGAGNQEVWIVESSSGGKSKIRRFQINPFSNLSDTEIAAVTATSGSQLPLSVSSYSGVRIYSPDAIENVVRVIDPDLHKLIATIEVGEHPKGIAISPDKTRVYIANNEGNSISVIDAGSNQVIKTVPVGEEPMGICVSSDGSKIYVANVGKKGAGTATYLDDGSAAPVPGFIPGSISVIDGTSFTVETIEPVDHPYGLVLSADEKELFVTNYYSKSVTRINTLTKQIDPKTIPVGNEPTGIALSPDGKILAVANHRSNGVRALSLIDLSQSPQATVQNIDLKIRLPENVLFHPNEKKVYLGVNGIQEYDLSTQSQRTVITSPNQMKNFELHPNGTTVIGIHPGDEKVTYGLEHGRLTQSADLDYSTKLNGYSKTVLEGPTTDKTLIHYSNPEVSYAHETFGRFITRGSVSTPPPIITSTRAYIPNYGDGTVSVVNLSPGEPRLLTTIHLPDNGSSRPQPNGVTVSPGGDHVFIADDNGNRIFVIDPFTNRVERIVSVGEYPREMVLNQDGSLLYVTDLLQDQVEVLRTDTWESVASIPVGDEPDGIDISPDGKTLLGRQ
jgi:YVTN family beta-propeller protein